MEEGLLAEVYDRLDKAELDGDLGALVMAACEDQLHDVLQGQPVQRRQITVEEEGPPVGAYLTGITVEGFRGIGPQRKLPLQPGPGLTVVVGRNGSGKSSFAEAVEVALTGSSSRWDSAESKVWLDGWRNLHDGTPKLRVDVVEEGSSTPTGLVRTWSDPDDLSCGQTMVRRAGEDEQPLSVLGWADALARHRPILSYHELGTMLQGRPTVLHDALSAILGVGDIGHAVDRLGDARRGFEQPAKDVKDKRSAVLDRLRGSEDDRATAVLTSLEKRTPDLDAAEVHLLDDEEQSEAATTTLRTLASLELPDPAGVRQAAQELTTALADADDVGGTDAGRALHLADLLTKALQVHRHDQAERCPVCGVGSLDEEWVQRTEEQVAHLTEDARRARQADAELTRAAGHVRRLISDPPTALGSAAELGVDADDAKRAWGVWTDAPAKSEELPDHLDATYDMLHLTVEELKDRARQELDRRQSEWKPVAAQALAFIGEAREAAKSTVRARQLKDAEKWLKECQAAIKRDRFAPVREQTQRLWEQLRLASNVEVRDISLLGSMGSSHRKLLLDVAVDGTEANALGVMSQGELHALALSIFIPRATRPESPFRFLLIDDPVQSMDPARVDGLARMLSSVGQTRQVVVFTHDDRLPESLRRLRLDGAIIGVTRQPRSVVTVKPESDPASRALDDAKTMAKSVDLGLHVRNILVGGFVRTALEAACAERYTRTALGQGQSHREVEDALITANTLRSRMCLALFNDTEGDYKARLRQWDKRYADVVVWANDAAHGDAHRQSDEREMWQDVHVARDLCERLGRA